MPNLHLQSGNPLVFVKHTTAPTVWFFALSQPFNYSSQMTSCLTDDQISAHHNAAPDQDHLWLWNV